MRISPLEGLFPPMRRRILGAILAEPERDWYHSDLAHHLGVTASSLQGELKRLTESGVLESRRDRSRVYYRAAESCPVMDELKKLFEKGS